MAGLLDGWSALGVLVGVTHSAAAYATVSALHVVGVALLFGPILLVDLRLVGLVTALDAPAMQVLRRTARIGLVLVLVTGVLLAATRPQEYLANRVFLAKLAVVAVGIANAVWFERRHGRLALDGAGARGAAAISLAAWLAALFLGRWIAFV